jgi:hypothetical protein
LKNLRFWSSLIERNRPIFSSSPVATTHKREALKHKASRFSYSPPWVCKTRAFTVLVNRLSDNEEPQRCVASLPAYRYLFAFVGITEWTFLVWLHWWFPA